MGSLLLAVIYLIFISLGLPDSLLGSGWPTMQLAFGVPSSWAGYVSMTISFMTIISALLSPRMIRRFHTKWIVIVSIFMTVLGLLGFSICRSYWMLFLFAVPYGLGAGAIDAAVNHYVANHYPSSVMNLHSILIKWREALPLNSIFAILRQRHEVHFDRLLKTIHCTISAISACTLRLSTLLQ